MSSTAMSRTEANEKAESRGRALANLRRKIRTSAERMTGVGASVAGGFAAGVVRAKAPDMGIGGIHANQIGGGVAVAVGLSGILDDDTSDLVANFGAGILSYELGREVEKRVLASKK